MTGRDGAGTGAYPPIGEYAFLSDCRTAALVGPDAAVEWLCAPRVDSASVFARLLDRAAGGAWELRVADAGPSGRRYDGTAPVLETRWESPSGTAVGHDFLAVRPPGGEEHRGPVPTGLLVRLLRCERGRVEVRHRLRARPDYARRAARWTGDPDTGALAEEGAGLWLAAAGSGALPGEDPRPRTTADGDAEITAELGAGETLAVVLGYDGRWRGRLDTGRARRLLRETRDAWHAWSAPVLYNGYGADHVRRSAVVLRALMSSDTAALVAAPTTSLPEWPGGERNWDYRYVWHRDAALVVLVLMRLGHRAEAGAYLRGLLRHCTASRGVLTPMLDIDGRTESTERTLDHLEGYRGSRPVRVGNAAHAQTQLDVYGQVLDAVLVFQQVAVGSGGGGAGAGLDGSERATVYGVVETACRLWREPDHGIWEIRDGPRHWTSSKLYLWVCLDRGIRLAELTGDPGQPLERWRAQRDELRESILTHGYDDTVGAFVQSYGSRNLDASLLRIPLLGFLDGRDPRVLSTLDAIAAGLGEGPLIHRYDPRATADGLEGPEGGFLLCSFDMVSALVLAGRLDEARERFEALCARAGHFGLFAEEQSADGAMLGNYPQAFTHLALIEAAMNLDEAGHEESLHAWATRGARGPA
ncbi:glycoside hydrolase family 15 protein [Streptomyces sp. DH37]|uniref:glycoside hydrolase family 15 protein n=1 Tax=Streptomyces sp. DH37 TaxID=3040122 RepID=UPI0024412B7D|nr:glycoside hydrolase family 15 protein [Streptomyces sp. DH37]MDG9702317.1 glycoside hydrolase family 15 protein [Streptomyces sp. DH37]